MSFSNLFNSGFTTRNQDHFASIVKVALSDDALSQEEKAFLDRLAHLLNLSKETYDRILKRYKSHPINPSVSKKQRLECLYDLSRMVYADDIKKSREVSMLSKIAIGLGFETKVVPELVNFSLQLVKKNVDFETFKKEIIKTLYTK
ncbi:MAG: TerB family tellurite resistance protein [Formosa sp.]|nr:TerB family tellurite resistance protein [Formosa sp.]